MGRLITRFEATKSTALECTPTNLAYLGNFGGPASISIGIVDARCPHRGLLVSGLGKLVLVLFKARYGVILLQIYFYY